jgi:hypothetical protein
MTELDEIAVAIELVAGIVHDAVPSGLHRRVLGQRNIEELLAVVAAGTAAATAEH